MLKRSLTIAVVALAILSAGAYATPYMGITIGKQTYACGDQLVFSNVGSDIQWVVGSYKWTKVNGSWYGANPAASPGTGYGEIHRKFDAMALFFQPEIDIGTTNYGVGLRDGGLFWGTVDPGSSQPWYQVHKAEGGTDVISARNAGTIGTIVKNPQWDHVDHHTMAAYSPNAYAFFRAGSGTLMSGTASVTCSDTGIDLAGYSVYAYEVTVPWTVLEINPGHYAFSASWRPDCGNDIIVGSFSGNRQTPPPSAPEASTLFLALSGLSAIAAARRRR